MSDYSKAPIMKKLGVAVVEYLCPKSEETLILDKKQSNWFKEDLVTDNSRKGALVTTQDFDKYIKKIQINLSNPNWIDGQKTM